MTVPSFDDLTDIYEAMIDWPKRLAHEGPFYRRWFAQVGAGSVLDVACGTGRHAALFHEWSLRVEAADVSPAMIQRARASFGEPAGLRWVVRGFAEAFAVPAPFDAALCVGNSLALAPDEATVQAAIARMLAAVRPGGIIILHVLNLWHLPDGPCIWQKCRRVERRDAPGRDPEKSPSLPAPDTLIIKGVHRCGRRGYVELIVTDLSAPPRMRTDSVPFLGLEADQLQQMARAVGAARGQWFGGYQDQPYERETSPDLIVVAKKD